jgi:hypothetical protein
VKVRISGPAREKASRLDRWWRENRRDTRHLFAEEFGEARRQLAISPDRGEVYEERNGAVVRRILLPKTDTHVYYEIDRAKSTVMIFMLWGARKGRRPKL